VLILLGMSAACCYAQEKADGNETVVTADTLEYDLKNATATFRGHVVVKAPKINIQADQLVVLFDKESQIERAHAQGNVRIHDGRSVATCRRAAYGAKKGEVILTGKARLVREKDTVTGDRITFWLREERMLVEPGRLVVYPKRSGKPF